MNAWLLCAAHRAVVRRALASALLVGPVLAAINHADAIAEGDVSAGRLIRIVLTMLVPYAVSTCSSVQALAPSGPPEPSRPASGVGTGPLPEDTHAQRRPSCDQH